jgi:diguanylate cyclase (GGDEF)-like protein/PAS domain S-box-containing protein
MVVPPPRATTVAQPSEEHLLGPVPDLRPGPVTGAGAVGARSICDDTFKQLFECNPLPMWVYALDDLSVLAVNEAALVQYGYCAEEFLAMRITELRPPEDWERLRRDVREPGPSLRPSGLWRHLRRDGSVIDVDVRAHRLTFSGRPASLVLALDVTERLRAERELARLALHDALTGLPNRALLVDRLGQSIAHAERGSMVPAVIFLDLDRFKTVNDGKGYSAGDRVLVEVAKRLSEVAGPGSTVGRVGGDEFAIVVEAVAGLDEAKAVSRRVAWALEAPFELAAARVFVSASQGIALASPGEPAERVLSKADIAMRAAKASGSARPKVADDKAVARESSRLDGEIELRRAIEEDELVLHYQPIVRLGPLEVVGAEALVRWAHPERGLLGPGEFLPIAEASRLIIPLGEWVLRHALADAAAWVALDGSASDASIAINLAAAQLGVANLAFVIARSIRAAGIAASRVHLEVTEGALIRDLDRAAEVLGALRDLGVHVDVDDYGTGFSSLSYVQRLPVDTLKLDRTFVTRLGSAGGDDSIAASVLGLGRSLQLAVIAERVETLEQKHRLEELGYELAQGFLFARPMPGAEFRRLLTSGPLASGVLPSRSAP